MLLDPGKRGVKKTAAAFFAKSGLAIALMNKMGTIDILDDIMDHWTARSHRDERAQAVRAMHVGGLWLQYKRRELVAWQGTSHAAVGEFNMCDLPFIVPALCNCLTIVALVDEL
jgi:hypothetical protein